MPVGTSIARAGFQIGYPSGVFTRAYCWNRCDQIANNQGLVEDKLISWKNMRLAIRSGFAASPFFGECKPRLDNTKVVKDLTSGNSLQNRWKSVSNQSHSGIRIDAIFTSASVYPGYGNGVGIV